MESGETVPGRIAGMQMCRQHWTLILILGLLAAAILWFAAGKHHYVTDFSAASYSGYFWPRRWGLLLHLSGGAVAISVGLVQLWLGFSGLTTTLHRRLGRIYVATVLLASAGGAYMALTIPGHLAYASGLLALDGAWLVTTGMAVLAISRGDVAQHRAWMIRSYAVTFAFVTFRLLSALLKDRVQVADDPVATDLDAALAWACWAVPLLIVEPFIQMRVVGRKAAA